MQSFMKIKFGIILNLKSSKIESILIVTTMSLSMNNIIGSKVVKIGILRKIVGGMWDHES